MVWPIAFRPGNKMRSAASERIATGGPSRSALRNARPRTMGMRKVSMYPGVA